MSTRKVRIGIIGIGQIGKAHLRRYSEIEDAEIVAAADLNAGELTKVAEQFRIPDTYADFRELLKRDDIEAVDVCLHNNLHMPVTVAAMEAGKHVYCEKPMAGSYRDAVTMAEAGRELNKLLHIQLNTLFRDEALAAKHLIDMGKLGEVYHARSTGWRRRGRPFVDGYGTKFFVQKAHASGGALYDMGVYHIALMLYLLGNPEVARVTGKIYQKTPMDEIRKAESAYDVEEFATGFVRFTDDTTLDITEAWAVHLDAFEGSYVLGVEGGVRLQPFGFFHSIGDLDMDCTVNLGASNRRRHDLRPNPDAYDSAQHHWIAVLQERVPLIPTADLALKTMQISEGIYMADRLGHDVSAEEVLEASKSTASAI